MRSLDTWGTGRRVAVVALALAMLASIAAWPAVDAFGRAGIVFGEAVLGMPAHRIAPALPEPLEEELTWPGGGYARLIRPDDAHRHPALLIALGAEPADPDDPRVRRLTGSLARIGFVVLLVRSEPLIDGSVTPDEVPILVGAFHALERHAAVRADRIGLFGLSTGGALQLVAAADPAIAGRVHSVVVMGSYYDAGLLTAEVLSREHRGGQAGAAASTRDDSISWEPDETAVRVVQNTLLAALPSAEAAIAASGGQPATEDGRVVRELLRQPSFDVARVLLDRLSPGTRERMAVISPSMYGGRVRAPMYVIHDRSDRFIPVHHSDAIAVHYQPAVYHRLDIFQHVEPHPANAGVLLRDGSKLMRLFATVIRESRR